MAVWIVEFQSFGGSVLLPLEMREPPGRSRPHIIYRSGCAFISCWAPCRKEIGSWRVRARSTMGKWRTGGTAEPPDSDSVCEVGFYLQVSLRPKNLGTHVDGYQGAFWRPQSRRVHPDTRLGPVTVSCAHHPASTCQAGRLVDESQL